jgi:hypothetical protein
MAMSGTPNRGRLSSNVRRGAQRKRGSGGIYRVRPGVWRVDIEILRDPVTARRRRSTRQIEGTRRDAEVALARLKVALEEHRLPSRGTTARSVRAVFGALHLVTATRIAQPVSRRPLTCVLDERVVGDNNRDRVSPASGERGRISVIYGRPARKLAGTCVAGADRGGNP